MNVLIAMDSFKGALSSDEQERLWKEESCGQADIRRRFAV